MSVSVILTSYNARQLRACLEALVAQPGADEIIVADCSQHNPADVLAVDFPRVRFLHFSETRTVPALRWAALRHCRGDVVAALEARSVPAPNWCAVLAEAHAANRDTLAIGGPVAPAQRGSARDEGLYFCEYGLFAPPVAVGPVTELSGANLSYKRAALEACADLLAAGAWETQLHARWRSQPNALRLSTATVYFVNEMSAPTALRQRFAYGRGYAAARFDRGERLRRLVYAACCPVLPLLLTCRIGRSLLGKGLLARFGRALWWVILFNSAWSVGECVGYVLGASATAENF